MHILLSLCSICIPFCGSATEESAGSVSRYFVNQKRSFANLDASAHQPELAEYSYPTPSLSHSDSINRAKIEATYNRIVEENRFISFLDEHALFDLPVGIKKEIGSLLYMVMIDSAVMTPVGTMLFASMYFRAPGVGKLEFMGAAMFTGSGGISGGRLQLIGDYPYSLGGSNQIIIHGQSNGTFVDFDCNGFKMMGLEATVEFSNKVIKPAASAEGIADNVSFDFKTTLSDWNDLMVGATIAPFEVIGLEGFVFEAEDAILDLSDIQNVPGSAFPPGYEKISPYLRSGSPMLWRGLFIKQLTITLPRQLATKGESGQKERVSLRAANMLIDDSGFTGIVSAMNLIPIDRGKLGEWSFSLDELKLSVLANSLNGAGFRGKLDIPINSKKGLSDEEKNKSYFGYSALIKPGSEYVFTVTSPTKLNFNLWNAAEVKLHPSSSVQIALEGNEFKPRAILNGVMTITAGLNNSDGTPDSDEKKNLKFNQIEFQNLVVKSDAPYVSVGYFSLGTKGSGAGGFPVTINKIEGGQMGDDIFLGVNVTLSLTGQDAGGFGADGTIRVVSTVVRENGELSFKFKGVVLNNFDIDIDGGKAFAFSGRLDFYKDDLVYGNGISGSVKATFVEKFTIEASAIFGTKDNFSYWYVDGLVELGNAVQPFPGVFLNKFGGGISYHMILDSEGVGSRLGKTRSGIVYVPSASAGLGLKSMVGLKAGNEKLFNANVTFEIVFNKGNGIKYVCFRGLAYLLSDPVPVSDEQLGQMAKKMAKSAGGSSELSDNIATMILGAPEASQASVVAGAYIMLDLDNNCLHASLNTQINVAGGMIRGGGNAVLHFAQNEWYIYIGRPERNSRMALEFSGLVRMDSYFVMGSKVPDTPPPPKEVSAILGGVNLDYMSNLNALADGAGIGFGASLSIDTGDKTFLIFYGRFNAGLGFDVMLKDYGKTTCSNGKRIGIDGWYANGQAYAYIDGKIGVKVKVFSVKKNVEILTIQGAFIAQAKLPNPVWFKAMVGGQFNALGGLVKGKCDFVLVIGEECTIQQSGGSSDSAIEAGEVVAQISPNQNNSAVDVFTYPQIVFNYELEKSYKLFDDEGKIIYFKIALDELKLTGPGSVNIPANVEWNSDRTVARVKPISHLPELATVTVAITTKFQEYKGETWVTAISDGREMKETKRVTFTTGKAPGVILTNNISYSYPSDGMLNFYKGEYSRGFLKLNQSQAYLFSDPNYESLIRFTSNGSAITAPLNYTTSTNEISYDVPSDLQTDRVYTLEFVNIPKAQTRVESAVVVTDTKLRIAEVDDISIANRTVSETVVNYEEHIIYTSHFRTSKFSTFLEKIQGTQPSSGWRDPYKAGVHFVKSNFGGPEPFSKEEMFGSNGSNPLVMIEADLSNNTWFENDLFPYLYKDYPYSNIKIMNRNPQTLGVIPTKGVIVYQIPYDFVLSDASVQSGVVSFSFAGRYDYYLPKYFFDDFLDMKTQAMNQIATRGSSDSRLQHLAYSSFPAIRKGDYWVNLHYKLPGTGETTSTYRLKITNPID